MSVDVEDYYQVSAFADAVARDDWPAMASRVERNTDAVLQMFADHGISATFFTLGCVAERYPSLVRRIVEQGHELASHGFAHWRVHEQSQAAFREDVARTKKLLEDVGGVGIEGYRAASFSINQSTRWAFDVLAEEGHRYSSSVYPIRHDLYGMPDAPRFRYLPTERSSFHEIPMTTLEIGRLKLPCSGGGYFRLLPYGYSRWALRRLNEREGQSAMFYFHPWEIDPDQPRIATRSWRSRLRHYTNLGRMEDRLRRLLRDFRWDRVDRVFLPAEEVPG
ncbi:MAG: DUF3473 domain-containing protein [Kiloniellales bacterium]|nr:DUF3473 domain-containing protein [Kiloniellales bacterium]